MTLPSSGPLALTDIQTEFGGSNPIGLNEYYAGGSYVPAGTTGTYGAVPSSGALSIQNFYGTTKFVAPRVISSVTRFSPIQNFTSTDGIAYTSNVSTTNLPYDCYINPQAAMVKFGSIYVSYTVPLSVQGTYYCYTSTDGINWVLRPIPSPSTNSTSNDRWMFLVTNGDYIFIVGYRGVLRSTDGINWTYSYNATFSIVPTRCAAITGGSKSLLLIRSTAGNDVINSTGTGTSYYNVQSNKRNLTGCGGIFWLVYGNSPYIFATSSDGVNWSTRSSASTGPLIGYANGYFYNSVGTTLNVYTNVISGSPTTCTGTVPYPLNITWSPTLSKYIGITSAIPYTAVYSSDGINWTAGNSVPDFTVQLVGV